MKNKFIIGLVTRLLKWSVKVNPDGSKIEYLRKTREIIQGLYSTYNPLFDANQFDKDMFKILFDIKYGSPKNTFVPYLRLNGFYEQAKEGNPAFLKDPFFRTLRKNKDKEVKKLMHILDRNMR